MGERNTDPHCHGGGLDHAHDHQEGRARGASTDDSRLFSHIIKRRSPSETRQLVCRGMWWAASIQVDLLPIHIEKFKRKNFDKKQLEHFMEIIPYHDNYKHQTISFIKNIWQELNKDWDPENRDRDFFDIPHFYQHSGGDFWLVLNYEKQVVGTIALQFLNNVTAQIRRFYINPNYRGQGLGQNLLHLVIITARTKGFTWLKLDTNKKSLTACKLFIKHGFVETKHDSLNDRTDTNMVLKLTN